MSIPKIFLPFVCLVAGGLAQTTPAVSSPPPITATPVTATEPAPPPALPTIFLAGDSTSQNGNPVATGWGRMFPEYFDATKVRIVNRSLGGRSSRTFITEGHWDKLVAELKAGDLVIIQFGMNDGADRNGPRVARGSIDGLGEEIEQIDNVVTKKPETVHTFGWYLRRYIAEIREKEATPILCTLVPRNSWKDGRIARATDSHADWTRAVATSEKVPLVDLNELIAKKYDALGQEAVTALFADKTVHTGWAGAELNALTVVEGLRALDPNPLAGHLRPTMGLVASKPDDIAPPGK